MNLSKSLISLASVGALLLSSSPALAAGVPTPQQAQERCQKVAGSEKSRCLVILNRARRLKLQNLDQHITGRGNTLREQRMISDNSSVRNIRKFASQTKKDMRVNKGNGVASRRTITDNAHAARWMCKEITNSVEKASCMRKNLDSVNRGAVSR